MIDLTDCSSCARDEYRFAETASHRELRAFRGVKTPRPARRNLLTICPLEPDAPFVSAVISWPSGAFARPPGRRDVDFCSQFGNSQEDDLRLGVDLAVRMVPEQHSI